MIKVVLAGIGGFIGASFRYMISNIISKHISPMRKYNRRVLHRLHTGRQHEALESFSGYEDIPGDRYLRRLDHLFCL